MIPAIGIDKLNTAIRSSPYTPIGLPPISGFGYETPASLACVYNLATPSPGCNPNIVTTPPQLVEAKSLQSWSHTIIDLPKTI